MPQALKGLDLLSGFAQSIMADASTTFSEAQLLFLSSLAQSCLHPLASVRRRALSILQRTLVQPQHHAPSVTAFTAVLFPLVESLAKEEMTLLDRDEIGETRAQGISVLCRMLLHYLPSLLNEREKLTMLWDRILLVLSSYHRQTLDDAVVLSPYLVA